MDDSFNELIQFPVWPLPETAVRVLWKFLLGCLIITLRDTIVPLCGVKVLHCAGGGGGGRDVGDGGGTLWCDGSNSSSSGRG